MDKIAASKSFDISHYQAGSISAEMGVRIVSAGLVEGKYPYHCLPRIRDDYLLLLTIKGSAMVQEQGQSKELSPGDWFLLLPRQEHTYQAITPWSLAYVHFSGWLVDSLLQNLSLLSIERLCFRQQNEAAAGLLQELVRSQQGSTASGEAYRNALLLQLLPTLKHNYLWKSPEMNRLSRFENFIAENLHRPLTLEILAEKMHLSKFHFARVFHEHFGEAPMKQVRKMRVERAMNLFRADPEARVDEVAARVGFADALHFSRVFRQVTGIPPSEFRRRVAEEFIT
jgi:AraC-like DNA-binding protein